MRRVALAVVAALAITTIFVAPASGATHGTDRPFKGSSSATETIVSLGPPVQLTGDGTLHGTHIGRATVHLDIATTGPNTFAGTATVTAANGDTITESLTGSGTVISQNPLTQSITIEATITGGTGRFADASGTNLTTGTTVQTSATTLVETSTFTGRISY